MRQYVWILMCMSMYPMFLSPVSIHFAIAESDGSFRRMPTVSSEKVGSVTAHGLRFHFAFDCMLPFSFTRLFRSPKEYDFELRNDESGETRRYESYWLLDHDNIDWSTFRCISVYMPAVYDHHGDEMMWYQPIMYGVCAREQDVYIVLDRFHISMFQTNADGEMTRVPHITPPYLTPQERQKIQDQSARQQDVWRQFGQLIGCGVLKYYHQSPHRKNVQRAGNNEKNSQQRIKELAIVPYEEMKHEVACFEDSNPFRDSPTLSEGSNTESVRSDASNSELAHL